MRSKKRRRTRFKRFRLIPVRSPLLGECSYAKAPEHKLCLSSVTLVKDDFFLFLRLLRCFNSPGSPLISLFIRLTGSPSTTGKVTPFGDPRVKGCLPPRRGFSQAATSFIVFLSQGIHHIPLRDFPTFLFLCSHKLIIQLLKGAPFTLSFNKKTAWRGLKPFSNKSGFTRVYWLKRQAELSYGFL